MNKTEVYIVDKSSSGMTLHNYLSKKLKFSRRSIVSMKKNEAVLLNGSISYMKALLKEMDEIEIYFKDSESENILPEQMKLDIVFEDDYLIVINKAAGIPVHPTKKYFMGTVANGLAYYWLDREEPMKIRPVNRIDKDTSGLVVFAKNAHIQHLLSLYNGSEEFEKEYLAVIEGQMPEKEGTIDLPIAREAENTMKRVVREDGDRSITHYRTSAVFDKYSIMKITLETGRTHQIRVHLSHLGHPLLGDTMYGGSTELIGRQALHAKKIIMLHPITKEWHCFTAVPPEDIMGLIL